MAKTRAQQNRAMRQEQLRELLASQGHLQHILDLCTKLSELDNELDAIEVSRLKHVIDTKLKLVNKFLPDLKNVELANDGGGQLTIQLVDFSDKAE